MGKPTLVLDMDETLIGMAVRESPDAEFESTCDMKALRDIGWLVPYICYVWKRPHVDDFLRTMAQHYNVVVYTSAHTIHASFVMDKLDPAHEFVVRIMDRRHAASRNSEGVWLKDLTKVRKNLKRVIWLDDTPEAYPAHQHDNGIVVPAFTLLGEGGSNKSLESLMDDKVLPQLTPFLVALSKLSDFRQAIAAYKAGMYEVIDERIVIDGKVLEPPDSYEDDDVVEADLKELEEQERLAEQEELTRKRKAVQEAEEAIERKNAQKKAEEDQKRAERDMSLWKCAIDKIDAAKMSACDKERAVEYISKKFKNYEADKLVFGLFSTGGEDMLVKELKGAGGAIKCDSMYVVLQEFFFGLKGPSNDYDTRRSILDILVKATVEFFYYGKPVKVDRQKYNEKIVKATMETQIAQFEYDYLDITLVFYEPICMNAARNFLWDNKLLPPGFEAPEPLRMGNFALEGWWQFLIPVEFDKFWQLHGGKVADMVTLSEICHDCPKLNGLYGLASEILPGKQQLGTCGDADKYQGATICGDKLAFAEEFFASALEDSRCKFLVCLGDGTVLFRSKFEDGTVAKCAIWVENVSSNDISELERLSKEDLFFCFAIGRCSRSFSFSTILLNAEDVFSDLHLSMLNSVKVDRVQFSSSVAEEIAIGHD